MENIPLKKTGSGLDILIFTIISILLILISGYIITVCSDDKKNQIDKRITKKWVNDKTLQVILGYDAITAISTQDGIIIIDAGISNFITYKYRRIIEKEFHCDNFIYLFNTHSHPDHIGGNQVFSNVKIVGHKNSIGEISEYWKQKEKIKLELKKIVDSYDQELSRINTDSEEWNEIYCQKIRYQSAYDDLAGNRIITPPTLTFSDQIELMAGELSFHLIYFGEAHSKSDIIIYCPELGLLFTGDLFSRYGRPGFQITNKFDFNRWQKTKKWILRRWDTIEKIITGHGEILTRDELDSFNTFIEEKWGKLK